LNQSCPQVQRSCGNCQIDDYGVRSMNTFMVLSRCSSMKRYASR
jgi:hypothetical protein